MREKFALHQFFKFVVTIIFGRLHCSNIVWGIWGSQFVPMATVYFCGCGYVWLSLGMRQTILHPVPSLRSSAKVTADVSLA